MDIQTKLQEIKERCDSATEGPWSEEYDQPYESAIINKYGKIEGISVWLDDAPEPEYNLKVHKNVEFIAHARTDIPMLLEMVEVYRKTFDSDDCYCTSDPVAVYCDICKFNRELEEIAEKYK